MSDRVPTGSTYRMLLKAVVAASDHDRFAVAIVVPNQAVAMHCLEMMNPITAPLREFARIKFTHREVGFANGSLIRFWCPEQDYRGFEINMLLVDNSWHFHTNSVWETWLKRMRDLENRNQVRKGLDPQASA